ncbi:hypothetical protein FACS1894142_2530 [Spirochaetia bacterium]|nr:hypothetical protein FACS1894142_2530 [Spirochaetia bacterium]
MNHDFSSLEEIAAARRDAWDTYKTSILNSPERKGEVDSLRMVYGDATMRYSCEVKGQPGPHGYPLYIALHGGGATSINESQWNDMKTRYLGSVQNGIYIAPRGVRDTWNTHSNAESYPLYDRLIENMMVFKNADPNRVYITGFSAGGDGVYAITPRMADRFAAANMSAGHPNGVDMRNLYNMPIALQCGQNDTAYSRNTVTAQYGIRLQELARQYPGHFVSTTWIHVNGTHNSWQDHDSNRGLKPVIADFTAWLNGESAQSLPVNTNAIDFVNRYTRNPLPSSVLWDVSARDGSQGDNLRTVPSFYWLSVPMNSSGGKINASYTRCENKIVVDTEGFPGALTVLLNEEMVDPFSPIHLRMNGTTTTHNPAISGELLTSSTRERGDPHYQFIMSITLTAP